MLHLIIISFYVIYLKITELFLVRLTKIKKII